MRQQRMAGLVALVVAMGLVGSVAGNEAAARVSGPSAAMNTTAAAGRAALRVAASPLPGAKPPRSYYGLHYGLLGYDAPYPDSGAIGSFRLWDTGTTWRDVQPVPTQWQWQRLDTAVSTAVAHGSSLLYVLGGAPRWAAKFPPLIHGRSGYRHSSPPKSDRQWVAYVAAVASRYKGRIRAYELWNESNIDGFYSGSIKRMVRLASLAQRTIKRIDKQAVVTTPSVTLRGGSGGRWLGEYARLGGLRWADVINVHLYPAATGKPEDGIVLLDKLRRKLRRAAGGRKPVWNSEMNYGLPRHSPGVSITGVQLGVNTQVAYVLRTYLLGWGNGVGRTYWYDWSSSPLLGIHMTDAPGSLAAGAPGRALGTAKRWMSGRVSPCQVNRRHLYSCVIDYGQGRRGVAHWNSAGASRLTAPRGTTSWVDQFDVSHAATSRTRMIVRGQPILFRYTVR